MHQPVHEVISSMRSSSSSASQMCPTVSSMMSFISADVISSSEPVKSYSMEVTWNCISVALVIGVADFFLDTIEHLLIHPIGAVFMEADQIVEHCHLVSSEGGQHVVAVMHGVVWLTPLVWHPLERFGGMLCQFRKWHSEAA